MLQIVGALILLIAGFAILRLLFRALISTASALAGLILLCLFGPALLAGYIDGQNGQYRYMGNNGPMQLEVPRDQYAGAVETMRNKIREGKVPRISLQRTTPGCTRCHTRPVTLVNQNGFISQVAAICYVPMRGHTRFCGLSARACQKRSVVWLSHLPDVMASVSFIWMPVLNVCRVYPLSTGNQDKRHRMKSLTTKTALDILIAWLQDNIDCESGIIFDNDEDKTDSAALLPCIEQARQDVRTLRHLQFQHLNR